MPVVNLIAAVVLSAVIAWVSARFVKLLRTGEIELNGTDFARRSDGQHSVNVTRFMFALAIGVHLAMMVFCVRNLMVCFS